MLRFYSTCTCISPAPSTPPPVSVEDSSADYQLLMAVSHVKEPWMESSGNLVAHINVGDNYHSRKEVWL